MEVLQMTMLNFNLDLQKQDNFSKAFTARQGDAGEQFSVTLFDNQVPYTPVSGDVVSLRVVTPTGKFASVAGSVNGNKVVFTLNGQVTSEAGYYQRAYVAVSNGSKLRTTQDLIFFSLGNSDINKGQADYYVAELDKLLQQLNEEFDEWLAEREQDYSDLLARIVALTNRVTGLEQDVQDLIDAIQANRINTTNLFDLSLVTQPQSAVRRRVSNDGLEIGSWGLGILDNANVRKLGLEAGKTYHGHLKATLLSLTGGAMRSDASQMGWVLYSGVTGYPSIWIARMTDSQVTEVANMKVGDSIVYDRTFTLPDNFYDSQANYQMLMYGRRDDNAVVDRVLFEDMTIQEGSVYTGHQPNSNDTLSRFDEERLVKSILIDPKMTGTNPPTIEGGDTPTTEVTYTSTGEMRIQNLSTGRARVFWSATALGLDVAVSKQPFNVKLVARVTSNGSQVEVGYSGQTGNPTFNVTATMNTYTATIQAEVNTAFCIYLQQGETLVIRELYIYPANTDITSKRIATIEDGLPDVKKMVTGTPDTLQNPNANTLTTSGRWKVYTGTNMPPLPIASGNYYWYFEVINFNPDNCLQRASLRYSGNPTSSNGNFEYTRQLVNGAWGAWQRFDLETVDGNNLSKTGANLNDEVIGGRYIYINPTSAPKSGTFYGEIIRYGGAYVMQRLTNTNATDETFQRVMINTVWQPWRKLDISPASGNINQRQAMDFNTVTDSGNFMNVSATLNCPNNETGSTWYVEVIKYSDTYLYQRATKVAASNATYDRQLLNGVWQPWQKITKT